MNPRHHKDLIAAYLEYVGNHEGTPLVHKWSFISTLAACLERRVWLDRAYYTLFPNLYVFIIGRSGILKKSTSTAVAVNLLREVKGLSIMSERLTAGSLVKQMVDAGKFYKYNGKDIKQSPLFAYASELSVFLGEVFGSITELLTTFYDCVPYDSNKPWVYKSISRGEENVYGPCLNILGASTHAWLRRCIPLAEIEGGFTSRIIFVVENSIPDRVVAWPATPDDFLDKKRKLIDDLREIHALNGPAVFSESAKAIFTAWYERHMKVDLPHNQDQRMCGYMARKGDTILKLSIVRSVSMRSDLVVTDEHIQWAIDELNVLEPEMRAAFGGNEGRKNSNALAFEIKKFLKLQRRAPYKVILSKFGPTYPGEDIKIALKQLVATSEISATKEPEGLMFADAL